MLVALRPEALHDIAVVAFHHDANFLLDTLVALGRGLRR